MCLCPLQISYNSVHLTLRTMDWLNLKFCLIDSDNVAQSPIPTITLEEVKNCEFLYIFCFYFWPLSRLWGVRVWNGVTYHKTNLILGAPMKVTRANHWRSRISLRFKTYCSISNRWRVFTALHGMQTRSCDENSVRLSVCPSVTLEEVKNCEFLNIFLFSDHSVVFEVFGFGNGVTYHKTNLILEALMNVLSPPSMCCRSATNSENYNGEVAPENWLHHQ